MRIPALLRTAALVGGLLFAGLAAAAQPQFPALTGRVVDQAGLLSPSVQQRLDTELAGHEKQSGQQIVVVTLPDLGGLPIEDYGYQLGRHWGIGEKGKDNGALLIVAVKEHKVRIDVGYGLEGTLTDALSDDIIRNVILPEFRQGRYQEGIVKGTAAILKVLDGSYEPVAKKKTRQRSAVGILMLLSFGVIFLPLILGTLLSGGPRTGTPTRHGYWGGYWGGGFGGGFGGGGFGGGGFSGGGGSFGGGGASGGW